MDILNLKVISITETACSDIVQGALCRLIFDKVIGYGQDDSGSIPADGRILLFATSRKTLEPTQLHIQ
jgi:hypothetical protein